MLVSRELNSCPDLMPAVKRLYLQAFPEDERLPFPLLLRLSMLMGGFRLYFNEGEFCGFAQYLEKGDICYVMFLAVSEHARGKGLGSELLRCLQQEKQGKRILLEIEIIDDAAENAAERRCRKGFYLKNGFAETDVFYNIRGVEYELLSFGGSITEDEFWEFAKSCGFPGKAE